jgi:hypothetical protein
VPAEPLLPPAPAAPVVPAEPLVPAEPVVPALPLAPAVPVVPALPLVPAVPVDPPVSDPPQPQRRPTARIMGARFMAPICCAQGGDPSRNFVICCRRGAPRSPRFWPSAVIFTDVLRAAFRYNGSTSS